MSIMIDIETGINITTNTEMTDMTELEELYKTLPPMTSEEATAI